MALNGRQIQVKTIQKNSWKTLRFDPEFNGRLIPKWEESCWKIKPESDMFHLYGKDNIVLFYTERYDQQPLVIKGAGAGAEVTASGVFADVLRTINN